MSQQKPQINQRKLLAKSRLFAVEQLDLTFSNGEKRQYERLVGSQVGAVVIVPMLDDDTVILIQEYAAGTDQYEWGLPKGRLESGETIEQGANRELKEEIGYGSKQLNQLRALTLAPGYMGHETHVVVAQQLYPESLPGDEPEPIQQKTASLKELESWVLNGEVSEGRTIAALYLAKTWLSQQQ